MIVTAATTHAIERFSERGGPAENRPLARLNYLFALAENAVPIGGNEFYARGSGSRGGGWILVIVDETIKTVYRPRRPDQLNRIHKAFSSGSLNPPRALIPHD